MSLRSLFIAGTLLGLGACQVVSGLSGLEAISDAGELRPGITAEDAAGSADAAARDDAGTRDAGMSPLDAGHGPDSGSTSADDDAGSDAAAPCAARGGGSCDPIEQCGCAAGEHCQVRPPSAAASCFKAGTRGQDKLCNNPDQCGSGTGCVEGVCRGFCTQDDQCEPGSSCLGLSEKADDPLSKIGVCYPRCNRGNGMNCATGLTCQTVKRADTTRSYCIAPLDPCPTREDGICDEAEGTGACATGSDAKDCECAPTLSEALCDHVKQCGCPSGRLCQVSGANLQATVCVAPGPKANGETCGSDADCKAGSCIGGLCKKYCTQDSECGDGLRLEVYTSAGTPARDVKACLDRCNFDTQTPCASGSACARLSEGELKGDYCIRQDPQCSLGQNDGVCDETSRLCPVGSDSGDCVCTPPVRGAPCDPVDQCGCMDGQACHATLRSNQPSTECTSVGTIARGRVCSVYTDCELGYGCFGGLCREYCGVNNDCGDGVCATGITLDGVEFSNLGSCLVSCDFASGSPCQAGSVCANIGGLNTCVVPISCSADLRNNGQCDEPEGTRLCIEGSDKPDCP